MSIRRATRPKIKLGICGEHGGEPSSVSFCHQFGLDYVSCSPFRVPIARLAAAHAMFFGREVDRTVPAWEFRSKGGEHAAPDGHETN